MTRPCTACKPAPPLPSPIPPPQDSTDDASTIYLDSTSGSAVGLPGASVNITDGGWHMVTLTTTPGSSKGFQLYLDAKLAATLPLPQPWVTSDPTGSSIGESSGGAPMHLDAPLRLCGRADGDLSRSFDGLVTELSIREVAATASEVQSMWDAVVDEFTVATAEEEPTLLLGSAGEAARDLQSLCLFMLLYACL